MAILVSEIPTGLAQGEQDAVDMALKRIGVKRALLKEGYLYKTSVDARKKRVHLVHTVCLNLDLDEGKLVERTASPQVRLLPKADLQVLFGAEKCVSRPVVVGFGPAGMFAALLLARYGLRPIVLERGADMDRRVKAVEGFWKTGVLDTDSNVQYGEGGAGTFSDGKLTTRISDPACRFVLEELCAHGAPAEILRRAKPHIGTDRLRGVVKSIRREIEQRGGEVHFGAKMDGLSFQNGRLSGLRAQDRQFAVSDVVLAIGHSARDTFRLLLGQEVRMEPKAFSVGVRIEHLQGELDAAMYGPYAGHPMLPACEYQLSQREKNGDCVYTFCMCPGGVVVPAASGSGMVVTNGMSEFARDGANANAALVVSVDARDFGTHPLDGVAFQEGLERAAYAAGGGGYCAPAQTVGRFLEGKPGLVLSRVQPTYARGVTGADLAALLPARVSGLLRKGLRAFDRKIHGFAAPDAVLTAVETRTSSPVRVVREEDFQARDIPGLYPCGEGAGYAGGIMSAAVDGVHVALRILAKYERQA